MKKPMLWAVFALFLSLSAYAGNDVHPKHTTQSPPGDAISASESAADARSASLSRSAATNLTAVDASSGAVVDVQTGDIVVGPPEATATTGPVEQTAKQEVTANPEIHVEGDTYEAPKIPVSTAYAPPAFSRMECGEVFGLAWQGQNGGGSLGAPVPRWMSRKIKDCEARFDGNWLGEIGMPLQAIEARCATKSMRDRFGGDSKGKAARASRCTQTLQADYRTEGYLDLLQGTVKALQDQNKALADELADCREAENRATDAFLECQKK